MFSQRGPLVGEGTRRRGEADSPFFLLYTVSPGRLPPAPSWVPGTSALPYTVAYFWLPHCSPIWSLKTLPVSIKLCSNIHNIKFTILTIFKHLIQGHKYNNMVVQPSPSSPELSRLLKLNLCPHRTLSPHPPPPALAPIISFP